jgi:thiol-disulfide isomerase/thioredoxin
MRKQGAIILPALFFLLVCLQLPAYNQVLPDYGRLSPAKQTKKITAFVFLSPECPLCRNYAAVLNALDSLYKKEVDIIGIFPGKAYTAAAYASYKEKYKVHFTLATDTAGVLVKELKATVTPEVFLMSKEGKVVYSGAIDDWATSLGKHRAAATRHYLQDAIVACLRQQPVAVPSVKAVGCLINDY